MSWLDRFTAPPAPSHEDVLRERQTEAALSVVDDFLQEVRENIRTLQDTARPERMDYPVASALKRRRPTP